MKDILYKALTASRDIMLALILAWRLSFAQIESYDLQCTMRLQLSERDQPNADKQGSHNIGVSAILYQSFPDILS